MTESDSGSLNPSEIDMPWPQQPEPIKNEYPACWDLVLQTVSNAQFTNPVQARAHQLLVYDMEHRDVSGAKKYGVRLQPFNGRNSVQDAYEEALDAIVYTRGAIFERQANRVVTPEHEFILQGLSICFKNFMDSALRLRVILDLTTQKETNEQSTTNTGDGRNSEEPRQHQSNIVVP